MNNKTEKLNNLLELLQRDKVTPKEIESFLIMVLEVIKNNTTEFQNTKEDIVAKVIQAVNEIEKQHNNVISEIEKQHENVLSDVDDKTSQAVASIESKIDEVKKLVKEIEMKEASHGIDGKDGESVSADDVVPLVLEKIVIPEETGETIADKLELLLGDKRLDASAIKNLPEATQGRMRGITNLRGLLTAGTNISFSGSGGVGDPYVVSALNGTTATWGSITGTLSAQTDLQTALNLKANIASPTFTGTVTTPALTLSTFTSGSILFAGTGGAVTQDNANLFWDDTNNRLGLGTATPVANLTVLDSGSSAIVGTNGVALFRKAYSALASPQLRVEGATAAAIEIASTSGNNQTARWQFLTGYNGQQMDIYTTAGASSPTLAYDTHVMSFLKTGLVGIGLTAPTARLHIVGSGATSATNSLAVHNSTGTSNSLVVRDDGMVGIGTASPLGMIDVRQGSGKISIYGQRFTDINGGTGSFFRFKDSVGSTDLYKVDTGGNTIQGKLTLQLGTGGDSGQTYQLDSGDITTVSNAQLYRFRQYTTTGGTVNSFGIELKRDNANLAGYSALYVNVTEDVTGTASNYMINLMRNSTSRFVVQSGGNVGIGTTAPTNVLSISGQSAQTLWLERHTTANTAGNNLTIQAGGATSGATNKAGGNLILAPGLSTGTGNNQILLQTSTPAGSGTADNALVTRVTLDSTALVSTVPVTLKAYTVATLPAGVQGMTAFVTDALAPTFLAVLVGGGAVVSTAFYNGTSWVAQ